MDYSGPRGSVALEVDAPGALCRWWFCCCCPPQPSAQSVSFSGTTASLNAGRVNLCGPDQAATPCFATFPLTYKVTESGTLGVPDVLTQGSPDLDFTLATTGNTCEGLVTAGTSCVVNVRFTPKYPGTRPGGVQVTDKTGKVLATTLIYGTGVGAQIGFLPGTVTVLDIRESSGNVPIVYGMSADGAGDLFVVYEISR